MSVSSVEGILVVQIFLKGTGPTTLIQVSQYAHDDCAEFN